jgi:hypothetical protein
MKIVVEDATLKRNKCNLEMRRKKRISRSNRATDINKKAKNLINVKYFKKRE